MNGDVDRLKTCGEALFGAQWQRDLAREIHVDDRLVRRWAAGDRPVPPERWGQIRALMRRRAAELARIDAEMDDGRISSRE